MAGSSPAMTIRSMYTPTLSPPPAGARISSARARRRARNSTPRRVGRRCGRRPADHSRRRRRRPRAPCRRCAAPQPFPRLSLAQRRIVLDLDRRKSDLVLAVAGAAADEFVAIAEGVRQLRIGFAVIARPRCRCCCRRTPWSRSPGRSCCRKPPGLPCRTRRPGSSARRRSARKTPGHRHHHRA